MTCPTLCLNMIVKNESKIITRLFDSISSLIDCYCICDTGSTDNTVQIIQDYFFKKNIPGKVVHKPFINFCYNRNFALQSALGMSNYILLMDADMLLEIKDFNKNDLLRGDSFHILQGNDNFYYQNVRIVKNDGLYSYTGVTHEYINMPNTNKLCSISKTQLFIRDIGDGGAKSDKFERDIKLLTDGIKDEPNNVRYFFYLANSYYDHGDYDKAIDIYKKRIELGGWNQEVWYSYFRIGNCYKNTGKHAEAIHSWMNGYDFLPDRLEGLYEIIHYYRNESKHKLCYLFYKLALDVLNKKHNIDEYLFLYKDIYSYKLHYEYTIIAAYIGIKNINDEIITILNNCNDENIKNNLFTNMKFYKNILKHDHLYIMDCEKTINIDNEDIKFNSSSICLIPDVNSGYLLNIRYVNYYIEPNNSYINCDKYIITVNQFVKLDASLKKVSEKTFDPNFDGRRYIGVEDVRIFRDVKDKIIFTGTGFHKDEKIGIVCGNYDTNKEKLVTNDIKPSFNNSYCEKNWVYVNYENETHMIYKWHPLEICKVNGTTLDLIKSIEMPRLFSHVRGSTCAFKYNDENWFVVHTVSYETPRHYHHMIVVMDTNMKLLRYSAPFKFEGEPIEYCLSIVVEDERVLMNFSTWDRTSRIAEYNKKYIDSILKY